MACELDSYTHYADVDPVHGERLYFFVIPLINEIDAASPMPQCGNGCSSDFVLTSRRTHVQCQECGATYRVHLTRDI